jgi:PAS domain S-box-containing protein
MPDDVVPSVPREGRLAWARLANDVTDVLATSRGLPEAAAGLLRSFASRLGAEEAALWVLDPTRDVLACTRTWTRGTDSTSELAPGERVLPAIETGVVGRAWARRIPTWTADLPEETSPAAGRGRSPKPAGEALAIPIAYGTVLHGVLELTRREFPAPTEDDRAVAAALGKQVGQFAAREEALRELHRSRRELADVFENAPVGLHLMDLKGRVLRANRAELELLGVTREELTGRLWRDFHVEPADADDLLARLAKAGSGPVGTADVRLRCKDGSVKRVRVDANVLLDEGRPVHVRTFVRDVTRVHETEAALRAGEERWRRLVEGAREYALHGLDPDGRVTGWNSGAQRLYGWGEGEVLSRDFALSFVPEDREDDVPARMLRLAADEGEFRHEGWRVRKDGSRFWAEVVYSALRDESGRLSGISQLTRDVSERRRLEALRRKGAEMESENRGVLEAGRLTSELMHSVLETVERPASEIQTAAARLRHGLDGAAGGDVDALLAGVASLRGALEALEETAAASRAPAGEEVPVDLLRLATETRDVFREEATARRLRVEVDVDPSLTGVVGDPVRIRQVLYNYLSNAIKFSRERGRVALRVLPEGDSRFRIEVEDSGLGIPTEDLARVWLGRKGADASGASGVGLPATKRIVEDQGGRVAVQSSLGRGSVFSAVLSRAPQASRAEEPAARPATETRRALVVSENPATRAGVSWALGHAGFEAATASQAEEAVDVLREERFDAVAVDLTLGGMGAVDFVATVRGGGASRDVPWVLAAVASSQAGAACLAVSDVLPRPAPADRLFASLERLHVPRGRRGTVVVVDGDVALLAGAKRTLELLGYEAAAEPDGDAALRACAEAAPSAVVLSPFLLGMDPFTFLRHLRQMPGLSRTPVVLLAPRTLEEAQVAALAEAAAVDRGWTRALRHDEAPPAGPRPLRSGDGE